MGYIILPNNHSISLSNTPTWPPFSLISPFSFTRLSPSLSHTKTNSFLFGHVYIKLQSLPHRIRDSEPSTMLLSNGVCSAYSLSQLYLESFHVSLLLMDTSAVAILVEVVSGELRRRGGGYSLRACVLRVRFFLALKQRAGTNVLRREIRGLYFPPLPPPPPPLPQV